MSLENQSTNDLINSIDYNPKKKYTIKDIYRTLDDLTQITEHEIFSYFLPSRQVEYLKMNIVYPQHLIIILIPPLILLTSRITSFYDLYICIMKYDI